MAYDMCEFEECFFNNPFSPLSDSSSIDILKTIQENNHNLNPLTHNILDTPFNEIDHFTPTITSTTTTFSTSPPCHQLQSLYIYQMGNSVNSPDLCPLKIKTEKGQLPFYDSFMSHDTYVGCDNLVKMMHRSLFESSNLQPITLTSHNHGLASSQTTQALSSSSSPFVEEANFKVGRYSPEERKVRILRYKAKRMQRNFNKTIKYACRKTLADNRPRIRGRFARNDESGETPNTFTFRRYDDVDRLWLEGLQEEYYEGVARGQFFNIYMPTTQFQEFTYLPK